MIAAQPALDRLAGRRVTVAGANREAAYVDDDGFVAVLTTAPPQLPNGVQVAQLPAVGEAVVVAGEPWDPTLHITGDRAALGGRILAATGEAGLEVADGGLAALARAVETRDPALAAAAGAALIGRGPGLTPEGDDLVAGAAGVLVATGAGDLVAALIGADLRVRTTSLSATLLELAARGMGPGPLQALMAGDPGALATPPPPRALHRPRLRDRRGVGARRERQRRWVGRRGARARRERQRRWVGEDGDSFLSSRSPWRVERLAPHRAHNVPHANASA